MMITILFGLIISGCNGGINKETKDDGDLTVYTSIYPIHFIVEQIVGDVGDVHSIYPPGVDAHTYEPTTREMTRLAHGDAFVYLGAGMEGFSEKAKETLANEEIQFIDIADRADDLFISEDHEHDGDHNHGDYDPHIWLDPIRMIQTAEIVTKELTALAPEHEETFQANLTTLEENLTHLHEQFEKTLDPKNNKQLLVAHAAYGYWEDRYGIEQIPISGLSTSDEPSQKELTQIVTQAKEKQFKYVIFEQTGTDKVADIIREQIQAEALHIHNLEALTEEDIKRKADYLSIMEENLDVLDQALEE